MSQEQGEKGVVVGWEGEVKVPEDLIQWARDNYLKGEVSANRAVEIVKFVKDKNDPKFQQQLVALMFELLDKLNKAGVPAEDMKKAEESYLYLLNAMKDVYPLQYGLFEARYEEKKAQSINASPASTPSVSISAVTVGQTLLTVITGWVPGMANLFQGDNAKVGPRLKSTITAASNLFKRLVANKEPKSSANESHGEIKTALAALEKMHGEIIQGIESGKPDLPLMREFNAKLSQLHDKIIKAGLTQDELGYQRKIVHWKQDISRITEGFKDEINLTREFHDLLKLHKLITSKSAKEANSKGVVEFNDKAIKFKELLKNPDLHMDEKVKGEYSSKLNRMIAEVVTVANKTNVQNKTEKKEPKSARNMTTKPSDSLVQRTHYHPPHGGRR